MQGRIQDFLMVRSSDDARKAREFFTAPLIDCSHPFAPNSAPPSHPLRTQPALIDSKFCVSQILYINPLIKYKKIRLFRNFKIYDPNGCGEFMVWRTSLNTPIIVCLQRRDFTENNQWGKVLVKLEDLSLKCGRACVVVFVCESVCE